ncbi:unnamed protein product [Caenorhabditis angaria]|uniref:Uncharacterized protein n=1 Tax=Caenorhabditis angaria TaxID=860376 RepID=A0A9P1IHT1_9PELO|nr:unnamed protein product [Caenorhabditis angaria]
MLYKALICKPPFLANKKKTGSSDKIARSLLETTVTECRDPIKSTIVISDASEQEDGKDTQRDQELLMERASQVSLF